MRKYFYLPLVLLVVVSIAAMNSAAAQDANVCLPPPDGLAGWWPGDGNTDDVIGGRDAEDIIPDLPNLAAAKPVRASASWPEAPAQNAVDGQESAESAWIAGSHPPQWLEIDLQQPATVALVRLVTEQYPAGATVHEIWGAGPGEELRLLHEFRGRTDTDQVLAFRPEMPLANIQLIRVLTTASPSWVAWREIEVYGSYDDPTSDINDSPPSENPVQVQPVTVAPALPEAHTENPVDTQVTVQMLYPRLAGAFIELQAEPLRPGLWTRLQWQDALGGWHDIEGWQGSFNPDQRVLWFVGEEHLGEGPFRWLVYESQEGDLLAVSEPFSLPSRGGEILQVAIALPKALPEKSAGGIPATAAPTPTPSHTLTATSPTSSSRAPSFSPADIYASRLVEEGTVGTSTQGIFGPNICTDYGDPFSPWNSIYAPGPYTYQYRIRIPSDYPEEAVRVEIFDPDSINTDVNEAQVWHTAAAQGAPGNLPAEASKMCGPDGGSEYRWNPCVLRTDELALTETYPDVYQLDNVNPFWVVRVDDNRGAPPAPGNGLCDPRTNYDPAFNTQTLFQLYYLGRSSGDSPVRIDLASYTGQVGDGVRDNGEHNTDLRWVSPGAELNVPVDAGSNKTFELRLADDLPGILVEPDTGNRYIYLDVTSLSGASENAFEIWAGPNSYVGTVPGNANERNVHVRNNPGSHSSKGVTVFALGNLPMNAVYGNRPDRPGEADRVVDIPLIYVGPEYAGSSILVSLFDSDSGARSPITFYFDSIAEEARSMTFSVEGQDDPDGVAAGTRCIIGSATNGCGSQWVDPPYEIQVPGILDSCDGQDSTAEDCTPFTGGRLMARYIGGEFDTYVWQVRQPDLP